MGQVIISAPQWSDNATLVASEFVAGFPVTRLQKMQPTDRWRASGITGPLSITCDRGEAKPFNLVSLMFTNGSSDASWRVRAAQTEAELDTNPIIDSSKHVVAGGYSQGGFSSAIRLDGVDGYADHAAHSPYGALTSFTLECRIRPHTIRRQGIASRGSSGSDDGLIGMRADGTIQWVEIPSVDGQCISTTVPPTGMWTHISASYDAGADTTYLYINGVLEDSTTGVTSFAPSGNITTLGPVEDERFDGDIDDVRLWDYARPAVEILADMHTQLAGSESGLVGYWKMLEATGLTAVNEVTGPTMTLESSVLWIYPEQLWASPGIGDWDRTPSLFFFDVGATVRWVKIDILDLPNPDGYFEAGRLYISSAYQAWSRTSTRPTSGRRWGGAPFGWRDTSRRTVLPGGQMVVRRIPERPTSRFTIVSADEDEFMQTAYEIDKARGTSRDVLVVLDPDSTYWAAHGMFYGLQSGDLEINDPNLGVFEHSYAIEGLI